MKSEPDAESHFESHSQRLYRTDALRLSAVREIIPQARVDVDAKHVRDDELYAETGIRRELESLHFFIVYE